MRPDARLILPTASPKRSRMKKRAARDALRSFRRGNEDVEQQEMDRERVERMNGRFLFNPRATLECSRRACCPRAMSVSHGDTA